MAKTNIWPLSLRLKLFRDNWLIIKQRYRLANPLPTYCVFCGTAIANGRVCSPCRLDLPWHPTLQQLRSPPNVDRLWVGLRYEYPIKASIRRMKFRQDFSMARLIGELVAEKFAAELDQLDGILIPIPLSFSGLLSRGFNQALEIAKPISQTLNLPVARNILSRRGNAAPQSSLPARSRRQNVASSFYLCEHISLDRRFIIVDDVITTGATLSVAAGVLKRAGAISVDALIAASV